MDSPHYGSAADSMATERFCYDCSFVLTAPALEKWSAPHLTCPRQMAGFFLT
jgi:hypothetical protein